MDKVSAKELRAAKAAMRQEQREAELDAYATEQAMSLPRPTREQAMRLVVLLKLVPRGPE